MIALDAIKARLAAATEFIRADYTSDGDRYCVACNEYFLLNDGCEFEPGESVCDPCAQRLWRHAPADIAALLAEVEAQRSELIALRRKVCRLEFDASVMSRRYNVHLHSTDRIVNVVSTKPAAAACFGAEQLNVRNGRVIVTDLDSAATWTFEIETEHKTLWYAREVVE